MSGVLREHESSRKQASVMGTRYEVVEEISRGGMGIVYRAWDPQLERHVALKVLRQETDDDPEARERFIREAQLAARLTHTNIVPVHDTGLWNGQYYIAMQLIDGSTLGDAELDLPALLRALKDVAWALDYAHQQGIVHRDIKPSNLMIDRSGHVYVTDFGLARRIGGAGKVTMSGIIVGTPAYMSPEQAQARETDARSDVYSFGATMYELFTGHPPHSGKDPLEILQAVLKEDPASARSARPDLSVDLETIVLKAMDKDPARRYPGMSVLARDLENFIGGKPILARRHGMLYQGRKWVYRHPKSTVAAVLAMLLLGGAYGAWVSHLRATGLEGDIAQRKKLDSLIAAFNSALKRGELNEASRLLVEIQDLSSSRAGPLSKALEEHRLDADLARLEKFVRDPGFDGLFASLEKRRPDLSRERQLRLRQAVYERGMASSKDEAIKWLDRAEALGAADWRLYERRGLLLAGEEKWVPARSDYDVFRRTRPANQPIPGEFSVLCLRTAGQHIADKRWELADGELKDAIDINSENHEAYHARGRVAAELQRPADVSVAYLEKAVLLYPQLKPDADYESIALKFCRETVAAHWKDESREKRMEAWKRAEGVLQLVMKGEAESAPALLLERARMRRRLGRYDEALADVGGARETPETLKTWLQIAFVKAARGEGSSSLAAARDRLQRVLESQPRDPWAWYWLATCTHPREYKESDRADMEATLSFLQRGAREGLAGLDASLQEARVRVELNLDLQKALDRISTVVAPSEMIVEEEYVAALYECRGLSLSQAMREFRRDAYLVRARAQFGMQNYPFCMGECSMALTLDPGYSKAYFFRGSARYLQADAAGGPAEEFKKSLDDFEQVMQHSRDAEEKSKAGKWIQTIRGRLPK